MADMITIMNRSPHDISLKIHEGDVPKKTVILKGAKRSPLYNKFQNNMLGLVGTTQVEKSFWDSWVSLNKESKYLTSQMIFSAKNAQEAEAKSREFSQAKTGYNGVAQNDLPHDISAAEIQA